MKIITINVQEHIIKLLKVIVDKKLVASRSEAIRRLLDYALPRWIGIQQIIDKMGDYELDALQFSKPIVEDTEHFTFEQLREMYPLLADYKYINEVLE